MRRYRSLGQLSSALLALFVALAAFAQQSGAAGGDTLEKIEPALVQKLQAGGTGWDAFVPTNYTITTYVELDLIEPLELAKIPNYDAAQFDPRFSAAGTVDGKVYAVPKDWGTTGYAVNTKQVAEKMTTWKQFWDLTIEKYSGRTTVHDYQLTLVPRLLRERGFRGRIGFFLHTPFPSLEVAQPYLQGAAGEYFWDVIRGMLGADLVGLQSLNDLARFVAAATRLPDVTRIRSRLRAMRAPSYPPSFPCGCG